MLVLELLGRLSLCRSDGAAPPAARQKRRLGLLAIIALAGKQGISRRRVEAYLWAESSSSRARHALDQTMYAIRRALGLDVIIAAGQELRLDPNLIAVDVWQFDAAIDAGDWASAVRLHTGPLLDGYEFGESQELESWLDRERARRLQAYRLAIESLADRSARTDDHAQHIAWRRRLVSADPLSAGSTTKLVRALAAAGDRAGAVKQAREYQEFVRHALEMDPEPEIEQLVAELSHSAPDIVTRTAAPREPPAIADPIVLPPEASTAPVAGGSWPARKAGIAGIASIAALVLLVVGVFAVQKVRASSASTVVANGSGSGRSATPSAEARAAYLRGVAAWEDRTKEGNDRATVHFRRATQLDPGYAEAYAGLAEAYVRIGYFGYRPADAMFPKAKAAALRAIALDSTNSAAHTALATESMWEHDFARAESEYERAISFDSTNATAHQWHGVLLMMLGKRAAAVEEERAASDLAPLNLQIQNNYATFLNIAGDRAGALRQFQKTVGEEPDSAWANRNPWVLANMARVYADDGEYSRATRMIGRAVAIVPRIPRALHTLAVIDDEMGRPDLALLAFARADSSNEQYAAYRGMVYGDRGIPDSAFLW
ncbi:MAG TPA: BTAD domain-containing putative transcriptional regulator, partial [Gemmatimonadaceae bacterium]